MSMTTFEPTRTDINGRIYTAFGAGFANVTAPKLSELSMNLTCALADGFNAGADVSTKEEQRFCDIKASTTLDKVTDTLSDFTVYGDGSVNEAAFLSMFADGATVGAFLRPYTLSSTALAVGQKGDPVNFKVAATVRGPVTSGEKWSYVVKVVEPKRGPLNTALVT